MSTIPNKSQIFFPRIDIVLSFPKIHGPLNEVVLFYFFRRFLCHLRTPAGHAQSLISCGSLWYSMHWLYGVKRVRNFHMRMWNWAASVRLNPVSTLDQRTRIAYAQWTMCTKHRPQISCSGTRSIDWHNCFWKDFHSKCDPRRLKSLQNNASYFIYVSSLADSH